MSQEAVRFLHFNSCVYELSVKDDNGTYITNHLMRQKNNTLIFENIALTTMNISPVAFVQSLQEEGIYRKILTLYPCKKIEDLPQEVAPFIAVKGTLLEKVDIDPDKMPMAIGEEDTPEARLQAVKNNLKLRYIRVSTCIIVPITERYMFDLTISHVPPQAITYIDKDQILPEQEEELPSAFTPSMTVDPTLPTLSDEEWKIYEEVLQIAQASEHETGKEMDKPAFEQILDELKPKYPKLNLVHLLDIINRATVINKAMKSRQ